MKAIKHLLWMLFALGMSFSFASCGGDDNDNQELPTPAPGIGEDASQLVGKWEDETGDWGFQLNADGSGISYEVGVTGEIYGPDPITWVYEKSTLTIYEVSESKYERYKVTYVDESSLHCIEYNDPNSSDTSEINVTFRKVNKFFWE